MALLIQSFLALNGSLRGHCPEVEDTTKAAIERAMGLLQKDGQPLAKYETTGRTFRIKTKHGMPVTLPPNYMLKELKACAQLLIGELRPKTSPEGGRRGGAGPISADTPADDT